MTIIILSFHAQFLFFFSKQEGVFNFAHGEKTSFTSRIVSTPASRKKFKNSIDGLINHKCLVNDAEVMSY